MNEDLTVLVNSCDKYEDAWEPFFRLYQIMGADKATSNPVILNTESKQFSCDYLNVVTYNNPNCKTWSERLMAVLDHIDSEYILLLLDDFFIQSPFDLEHFNLVLDYMRAHPEAGAVHTTPNGRFPKDAADMFLVRDFEKLNITITVVVWRKSFLRKLLRKHENIWQFEWYSTFRAKKLYPDTVIIQYNEKYPIIFDYRVNIAEGYGITESKWLPKNKELFDQYGIKVNYENLGWYVPHEKIKEPVTIKSLIPRTIKHIRTRISTYKSMR